VSELRQRTKKDPKQDPRGKRRRAAAELDLHFALPRGVTREQAREKCLTALAQIVEGAPR